MLAGVAAGLSKTAAAPIERVKLLVQNQGEMLKSGRLLEPYKGVVDCAARVMRDEGFVAFWRGNLANVLRYFPTQALNFAFKDAVKAAFKSSKNDSNAVAFGKNIASGGVAGALSLCFVYSLDYARTRLANDNKAAKKAAKAATKDGAAVVEAAAAKATHERQYNGLLDVYTKTIASDGFVGLYRGFVISCVGIVVYRGFYFGLYDTLKPILIGDTKGGAGFAASFALGYGVTVTSGLISYPLDTIRRRMMMTSGEAVKYKGSWDCTQQVLAKEGWQALFKGAGANILRGMAGAGVLAGFDEIQDAYVAWRYPEQYKAINEKSSKKKDA